MIDPSSAKYLINYDQMNRIDDNSRCFKRSVKGENWIPDEYPTAFDN